MGPSDHSIKSEVSEENYRFTVGLVGVFAGIASAIVS